MSFGDVEPREDPLVALVVGLSSIFGPVVLIVIIRVVMVQIRSLKTRRRAAREQLYFDAIRLESVVAGGTPPPLASS